MKGEKGIEPQEPVSRRLVNALLGLGFAGVLSGFLGTALTYLWPSRSRAAASDLLLGTEGPLDPGSIADNQGAVGRSRLGKVLVVHKGDAWVGLQATCTHLGCTVAWNAASAQVECPCHGARYDLGGRVLRGPARKALAEVELAVEEGRIRVLRLRES